MSNPLTSPDGAWMIGTLLGAAISAGPAYLAAKRSNRRVTGVEQSQHEATRQATVDALNAVMGPVTGRLDEMHATIADVRDWQAEHATTHAVDSLTRSPILEMRRND